MTTGRRPAGLAAALVVICASACSLMSCAGAPTAANGVPAGPRAGVAVTPTATFDRQGRLWVVWVEGSDVLVSHSVDLARTFAPPVRVTREPEDVDANGEARPKIAVGAGGEVFVSWTRRGEQPYTGDIRFSRSDDGGRTFAAPVTVNDDGLQTGHRFEALQVSPKGYVYLAWIDRRDAERASARGAEYTGAALYYAMSADGGRSFQPNRKIKDHICECCRLAIDVDPVGAPVVLWRDVIDGTTRDHAMAHFENDAVCGPPRRVTTDGWTINACPHHGPSLSIGEDGARHLVWFTGEGPSGPGAFYARSTDGGVTFTEPMRVSAPDAIAHAAVLSRGSRVLIAWKGKAGPEGTPVYLRESRDGGRRWGTARIVARVRGASDHPFVLANGAAFFLSWFTAVEGYRLVPLDGQG